MVACGMELPSFMQLSCNILFQGFRYNRGVARNGEKERGREQETLLPAFYPHSLFCWLTDTLFFVLSPLSECLAQATWRWLFKKKWFLHTVLCSV